MNRTKLNVAELFAGVGGFRAGLERVSSDFVTTFSSQWEPPGSAGKQFASRCYVAKFGVAGHYNEDIARVLDRIESGNQALGRIDMVVGGFPCQDYSVAKPLNQSTGIVGKKGVLWWQIHRLLSLLVQKGRPARWVLLENVDRLLKSPADQRGRDFAIMLAGLSDLGYDVEWRIVNAADYGFPQKRRRVFVLARRRARRRPSGADMVYSTGLLARSLPVRKPLSAEVGEGSHFSILGGLDEISRSFGRGVERTRFETAGFMRDREVWTYSPTPLRPIRASTLGDVLVDDIQVPSEYWIPESQLQRWSYAKGKKSEKRTHKASGFVYHYSEGAIPFPDHQDSPARTILTSEGGSGPSRSKHVVASSSGRLRRLTPLELERLNGFDDDWTLGLSAAQRAFCMGNALVVGIVSMIAQEIAAEAGLQLRSPKRQRLKG